MTSQALTEASRPPRAPAHAVAHEAPGRVAVQLACPVVVLILGADAANVCFPASFIGFSFSNFAVHLVAAELAAGGADLAAQTAADGGVDAEASSFCWKRRTLAASVAE